MADFKNYMTSNFISFTVVLLFQAILGKMSMTSGVNNDFVLQLFFVCTCITSLIYLTSRLPIKNPFFSICFQIFDMFFVVFILGVLFFQWIEITIQNLLLLSGMLLLTYFIVFGVMIMKNQADAHIINKKIMDMKVRSHDEKDN